MAAIEGFDHAPPAPPLPASEQESAARLECADWCNERDGHCNFEHVEVQCVCAGCSFCHSVTAAMSEARLLRLCPALRRTKTHFNGGASSAHIEPTIQPSAGMYNTEMLEGLDYVLDALHRRGMCAVLTLSNMWQWSGGFASYVWWATGEAPPKMTAVEQVCTSTARSESCCRAKGVLCCSLVRHLIGRRRGVCGWM